MAAMGSKEWLKWFTSVYELNRIIHENELYDQNVSLRGGLCFWKQVWQYTGLPSVGLKGTSDSDPQSEHFILCISLGPESYLRLPPPNVP
jgi:hypothetical protein